MTNTAPMPMCPMATMCKGMMEGRRSRMWMLVPGIVFIVLGVLIILYPQILAWLVAIAMIMIGVAMLMMINIMRGFGNKMHDASS